MEQVISQLRLLCHNSPDYDFGRTRELFNGFWGSRFHIETITKTSIDTERFEQCIYKIHLKEKIDQRGSPEPQIFDACFFVKDNLPVGSGFISLAKFINEGYILKLAVMGCSGHQEFCLHNTQLNILESRNITDLIFSVEAFGTIDDPKIMKILKCIFTDIDSGSDCNANNIVTSTNIIFEHIDFPRISMTIESKSSFDQIVNFFLKEFDRLNDNN